MQCSFIVLVRCYYHQMTKVNKERKTLKTVVDVISFILTTFSLSLFLVFFPKFISKVNRLGHKYWLRSATLSINLTNWTEILFFFCLLPFHLKYINLCTMFMVSCQFVPVWVLNWRFVRWLTGWLVEYLCIYSESTETMRTLTHAFILSFCFQINDLKHIITYFNSL